MGRGEGWKKRGVDAERANTPTIKSEEGPDDLKGGREKSDRSRTMTGELIICENSNFDREETRRDRTKRLRKVAGEGI